MFIVLLLILIPLIYVFIKYTYNYWKRNGIPQDEKTIIPVGCLWDSVKQTKSAGQCITDVYERTKGDFIGIYMFFRPALLIRNVDLARDILITNFANFHDRGVYDGGKDDPLHSHLFSQRGKDWADMRKKLSPSFTSGKIKAMFVTSNDVANRLVEYLNAQIPDNEVKEFDMKNVYTTYSIEIIASVIFGLDINGFENPKNKFRGIIEEASKNTPANVINAIVSILIPSLFPIFQKLGLENNAIYNLKDLIKDVIEMRKRNGIVRKDILQLLLQLQASGEINTDDDNWSIKNNSNSNVDHFSLDNITSQSFLFYFAGQETTAATASFTIAELAMHPKILHKVQKEVDEVMEKHEGKFSYEALQDMEYLELCIKETLRKYPGLPTLNRECTKDYQIPGTDKIIKKGTSVVIPVLGFHHNPENFPDPEEYIPERFLGETSNAYMPFGEGPHICIAQRSGRVNVKLGVAQILYSFNLEPMAKRTYEAEPQAVTIIPKGGVHVKLSKRQKKN